MAIAEDALRNRNSWAAGLNPYGSGIKGWRLPSVTDIGNDGYNGGMTTILTEGVRSI
jgi:hypothetical protein